MLIIMLFRYQYGNILYFLAHIVQSILALKELLSLYCIDFAMYSFGITAFKINMATKKNKTNKQKTTVLMRNSFY